VGAGHLEKLLSTLRWYIVCWMISTGLAIAIVWWIVAEELALDSIFVLIILLGVSLFFGLFAGLWVTKRVSEPLLKVSQAIFHVAPSAHLVPAPDMEKIGLGRELVTSLVRQVYDFAAQSQDPELSGPSLENILQQLPAPTIGLDKQQNIIFINAKAQEFSGSHDSIIGKHIYTVFEMMFKSGETLDDWLKTCQQSSVTASKSWHGIRLSNPMSGDIKYFDLAANFSKSNPSGAELILSMYDQTDIYAEDDSSLGFIALAVHELRTPLTLLRGYIEIFDEEFRGKLNPEMTVFMQKMEASAESLSAFVTNILNVARVEQNQLSLSLHEENWKELLERIVSDMQLRAGVHEKTITLTVPENLPTVAVDRVSISEVMNNLLDNAIKYSPPGKNDIIVTTHLTNDNFIETSVQDHGVGIPESVIPHLFEKFSRNHRNRAAISGTGLGLYLSKSIIGAHSGNIWVRSHENEGSTFSFTILPFSRLAENGPTPDNKGITRTAHGWIKNHSLSRQ